MYDDVILEFRTARTFINLNSEDDVNGGYGVAEDDVLFAF
jgi:hypothetical protein